MRGLRRYQEAEALLLEGYNGLKNAPEATPDLIKVARIRLARLYRNLNLPDKEKEYTDP